MPDIELDLDHGVPDLSDGAGAPRHRVAIWLAVAAIVGLICWAVVNPTGAPDHRAAASQPSVATVPTALYADSSYSITTSGSQISMMFPIRPPGIILNWVTPSVEPIRGLSDVSIYVVPISNTDITPADAGAVADKAVDTLAATDNFMVAILAKVTCGQAIPVHQDLFAHIEYRNSFTLTYVTIEGLSVSADDLTAGCHPAA